MREKVKTLLIPTAALAAACLVCVMRQTAPASSPQSAGADTVAIVLGDVRTLAARRLAGKADEYFHGGVTDIDCSLEHSHHGCAHDHHHEHHGEHEHAGEDDEVQDDDEAQDEAAPVRAPWRFVTRAIRLPSIERHLEGESSREILPWLWAALRVDSGNVSAYANAAYVLDALYGDKEKALAVLEEGRKTNPDSSELEFQKGELLLHGFKAPGKAEAAFRAALAKAPNDRHLKNREDIDAPLLEIRALSYLGRFASNRGDGKELRRCYEMARAIDADHTVTKSLRKLVEEAANEQ